MKKLKDEDLVDRLGRFDRNRAEKLVLCVVRPEDFKDVMALVEAAFDLGWSVGRRTTTSDDWADT